MQTFGSASIFLGLCMIILSSLSVCKGLYNMVFKFPKDIWGDVYHPIFSGFIGYVLSAIPGLAGMSACGILK